MKCWATSISASNVNCLRVECSDRLLDRQIEQLKRCETITEAEVKQLCLQAREILVEEGNVQYVDSPVTVSDLYNDVVRA